MSHIRTFHQQNQVSQNSYQGCIKTSENIHIKIKAPKISQVPSAPSTAPNQDLEDLDVLYNFKIKIAKIWNMRVSNTSHYVPIKIKTLNPHQEPLVSAKA